MGPGCTGHRRDKQSLFGRDDCNQALPLATLSNKMYSRNWWPMREIFNFLSHFLDHIHCLIFYCKTQIGQFFLSQNFLMAYFYVHERRVACDGKNSHFLFYTVNRTQMSHSHWAIFEEFGSIFTRPYNALQYISWSCKGSIKKNEWGAFKKKIEGKLSKKFKGRLQKKKLRKPS